MPETVSRHCLAWLIAIYDLDLWIEGKSTCGDVVVVGQPVHMLIISTKPNTDAIAEAEAVDADNDASAGLDCGFLAEVSVFQSCSSAAWHGAAMQCRAINA